MIPTAPHPTRAHTIADTLARRSRSGVLAYAALATILATCTSVGRADVGRSLAFVVSALVIGLARLGLARAGAGASERESRTWQVAFRAAALAAGTFWGVVAGLIVHHGLDTDALIVLVVTAGIVIGATVSLSPDLRLARVYILLVLAPVTLSTASLPTTQALGAATTIAFLLVFLQVQATNLHREFIEGLTAADLLAERAEALELSRARAEAAEHQATAASRAKSDFLANMSHEIRTPLTAILGYAELLLGVDLASGDRIGHAQTIHRNGDHLLRLLNDILDLSKIESGKMTVEAAPCSIVDVLADVESLLRVRASEHDLDFVVSLDSPVPKTILADAGRLRQILINLAGNAIKFTERGGVSVRARLEGALGAQPRLVIDVIDTGCGMSLEQVSGLFVPFAQVDSSASRRHQGTGLGLDISRRFARIMGGDVRVESVPGRGSRFTLDVPVHDAAPGETRSSLRTADRSSREIPLANLGGVRILLAEDGIDNQRLIAAVLRKAGAQVVVANDGVGAIAAAFESLEQEVPFDLVLMDIDMPELDGYGATARLRANGFRAPIVALTAHAMSGSRERCIAAGCDDHLTKPIDTSKMVRTIATLVARMKSDSAPQRAAPISTPPAPPPASGVLVRHSPLVSVLEDDPIVGSLLDGFCKSLQAYVPRVRAALANGDQMALVRAAHELVGSGGSFGFDAITEAARALEQAAREGSVAVREHAWTLVDLCERASESRLRRPVHEVVPARSPRAMAS